MENNVNHDTMTPIKLIIDTDPGIDDSMAILSAFNSPELDVIALTSIYGNVPTTMATRNAIHLTHIANRKDVPVIEGSHTSIRGVAKERIADFVHGSDGFGNTSQQIDNGQASAGSAAEYIVRCANEFPGQVTILALASLTNIALALQLDPQLAQKLHRVVVLGGAFHTSGNVNPAAEANIFGDPDAANIVFSRLTNCWVLGLDVTHQCLLPETEINNLAGKGKFGSFLQSISQFYLQYHRKMYHMDAVYLHDAAALAAVVNPSLFDWVDGKVVVVTDGPGKGKTIIDECKRDWVGDNAWKQLPVMKVALGVKSNELVSWVIDRMSR